MCSKMNERYQRAEQFLGLEFSRALNNTTLDPHWIDENHFWFKRDVPEGYEFIVVDSELLTERPAFDHQRLATTLTACLGQSASCRYLPIESFAYCSEQQLRLQIDPLVLKDTVVMLDLESYEGLLEPTNEHPAVERGVPLPSVVSPDGTMEIISREHNVFLRDCVTGKEKALTEDGEPHYGYGNYSDHLSVGCFPDAPLAPAVLWSADGRYLAVQRVDERQVSDMPVLQSVPEDRRLRPFSYRYKMALPGDAHVALTSLCVIDLDSGDIVASDRQPVPAYRNQPSMPTGSMPEIIGCGNAQWSTENRLYYVEWTRDSHQAVRLIEFDPLNGTSRVVVEEKGHGFFGPELLMLGQKIFAVLPERNEFIWYSRSSGWGHLYRYNLTTGELLNPITSGEYVVTKIHHIDDQKNSLYFTACGREDNRNPYYEHLYRVNKDGSDLVLLTPEPSHHDIVPSDPILPYSSFPSDIHSISPDGKVFVDTISRVDQPSKSILRSTYDGAELMALSHCDTTQMPDIPPVLPFCVKADDDVTDIWGALYRPDDFDEQKQYPVILFIYGTPQICITQKRYAEMLPLTSMRFYQSLAELGFIVVALDPRGTPLRSKAFHDVAYGNFQSGGGIDDQVAALKQLGERYTWMDMNRIGITGFSGGGFAAARAMFTHPDFFKVCVASAGNHDLRLYCSGWVEAAQGIMDGDNYEEQASASLAKHLKGKLLLTHGDRDANVPVANTLQLVDQLIKHNKDFDLLIFPNYQHDYYEDPYYLRRLWDYFVEHLLKETPPVNYCIASLQNRSRH